MDHEEEHLLGSEEAEQVVRAEKAAKFQHERRRTLPWVMGGIAGVFAISTLLLLAALVWRKDGFTDGSKDATYPDPTVPDHSNHTELLSLTSPDGKFYTMWWSTADAYNGNVIPHPRKQDVFLMVAHERYDGAGAHKRHELFCEAHFQGNYLVCANDAVPLPVSDPVPNTCPEPFQRRDGGPRDARVFYGPDHPYVIYGSLSQYTCIGLWVQDARMLLEPFRSEREFVEVYNEITEIGRPEPWSVIEKNYFLFWSEGKRYAHYNLYPERHFAELDDDGTAGTDLALVTAEQDGQCIAKYMPELGPGKESIHQATNSLSITLCKRSDVNCEPDENNTFIMEIFHHKTYFNFHGVYEPYVVLFQSVAPFAIHAISTRPLWIHGRTALTEKTRSAQYRGPGKTIPSGHTEMFYITSINWRTVGQHYHGYLDDPVFLGFGIEDTRSGVMDVRAGDLMHGLAYC
ncbi:hypothetical protein BDY17DRAFT_305289 [Neohortaea acidophila]|uniref:Uncharacterized protein n=1 Tax=Neohortaea acidophila TaxID=245834 RepID=A0A6A6PIC8_9PEZI|nr:uncharacterized protein BDY17DRAFT_305289 [Neohortaea acidophila]KAF2479283.1 hypothetical protein BDY17DRAFT_305289 [Neohortaea acidophila]